MRHVLLITAVLALGGCSASYTEPTLTADNPACPAAPESPPMERSHTLDLATPGPHAAGSRPDAPPATMPGVAARYACPMHTEVTSDQPGQRCPRCNMKLTMTGQAGGAE